jgi:hypothetical protein
MPVVAAVAEQHEGTVLHYDHDFDDIAKITGQKTEWIVPRGTGHGEGHSTGRDFRRPKGNCRLRTTQVNRTQNRTYSRPALRSRQDPRGRR